MTSARAKGNAYQRKCTKWIENNYKGAVVHNQAPKASVFIKDGKACYRSSKGNDILGAIDILAIIPGCKVVFLQVTLDTHVHKRLKDMTRIPWDRRYCIVQLWQDKGSGRTVIKELHQVGGVSTLMNIAEIVRGKCTIPEDLFK